MSPREPFVGPRGSRLYVEDQGEGTPVLALHGLGGGAFFFRSLAPRLTGVARLIAVDLPGTGRSTSSPADFTLDSWLDDLGALVRERVGAPVVLLGHSLGTILALEAWRRWPSDIRAMICLGGLPSVRPVIRERLTARLHDIRAHGLGGWGARAMPGIFGASALVRESSIVALYERVFEAQSVESYTRCIEILLAADASGIAATVTVPVHVLTGSDDQYAPPEDVIAFAQGFRARPMPTVLPACGHLAFFEDPDALASTLADFLGSR